MCCTEDDVRDLDNRVRNIEEALGDTLSWKKKFETEERIRFHEYKGKVAAEGRLRQLENALTDAGIEVSNKMKLSGTPFKQIERLNAELVKAVEALRGAAHLADPSSQVAVYLDQKLKELK